MVPVRQSFPFQSSPPIFTVNIRSFSGEYTIWFSKPIGSMYGLWYIYLTYIYHKNQPTCRWIYHTWYIHMDPIGNRTVDIFLKQAAPRATWDWSGRKLVLVLANVGGCSGKMVNFVEFGENAGGKRVGYLRTFKVDVLPYLYIYFTHVSWFLVEVWAPSPLFWGLSNETRAPLVV